MHPHAQLIQTFYEAFQRKDAEAMAACYHPEVVFSDPAFPNLSGSRAGHMWRMLCGRGKDLALEFSEVAADDLAGSAHWIARYTFATTGKKVVNDIRASFEFKDGKIYRHTDRFDFKTWAGQALGLPGKLLGGFGFFQRTVQGNARKQLEAFIEKRGLS